MEIRVSYEHSLACAPAEFIVLVPSQVIAECAGQRPARGCRNTWLI